VSPDPDATERARLVEQARLDLLSTGEQASYDGYESIAIEIDDAVAVVTLLDSLSRSEPELLRFCTTVRADRAVRAIVIRGRDDVDYFSQGGDVSTMRARAQLVGERAPELSTIRPGASWVDRVPPGREHDYIYTFLSVEQPMVAAITGHCVGAGTLLSLLCDLRVMNEDAKIGDPHVKVGLASGSTSIFLAMLLGPLRARRLVLTGDLVTGAEAAQIGLVDRAVPRADVVPEALALARRMAALPPLAVRWTKATLNDMVRVQVAAHTSAAAALEGLTMVSEDHLEAVDAFLEKRPGTYHGR
jgi:enoyl-CoA hydratase